MPWQLRVIIDVGGAPWPRPRTNKARYPMSSWRTHHQRSATVCASPTPTRASSCTHTPPRTHACGVARISCPTFKLHLDTGGHPATTHLCDKAASAEHFPHITRFTTSTSSTQIAENRQSLSVQEARRRTRRLLTRERPIMCAPASPLAQYRLFRKTKICS